jgi:hypothetical protein
MATEREKLLLTLLEASEDLARGYERELKRLRMNNLKIKLHMEVLVHNPNCKTASEIRKTYNEAPDFSESIIHFN